MNIISLNNHNVDKEHLCCALDSKSSFIGVSAKRDWIKSRFSEGLKFKKLDVQGKVFIEYIPAEYGWMPVDAPGYMLINCHWVAGSFKGKGYGKALLAECENDAKDMNGIIVVVGSKKKPFLPDKSFYIKNGFEVCDTAEPFFELLVKRFNKEAGLPKFRESVKSGMPQITAGIDIFYTAQCPYTSSYIEMIKPVAERSGIPVRIHNITSREDAQSHYVPFTTYSVFVNGKFHTIEILTPAKLEKIIVGIQ